MFLTEEEQMSEMYITVDKVAVTVLWQVEQTK